MTEFAREAIEAAILKHEAERKPYSLNEERQGQHEEEKERKPLASIPAKRRTKLPPSSNVREDTIQELKGLLNSGRWPSCKVMESEGILDLAIREAAHVWRRSGTPPDWRGVLDDLEKWFEDGDSNRKRRKA